MRRVLRALYARTPNSVRIMTGRFWKTRARIDRLFIPQARVDETLANTSLFFLLGSGRCGTMLISSMLNRDPQALVLHEPQRHADLSARPACRADPAAALRYVQSFRKYQIYKKVRESEVRAYGEVSQPLRCLGAALSTAFPHAKFMILVRDGRDVLRSAMNRQAGRGPNWNHPAAMPLLADEPYRSSWSSISDFEKFCWWWMDSYRLLFDHLPKAPVIQFEKVLADYDYVRTCILEPLSLNITRDQYNDAKSRKSDNAAERYTIPHWREWPRADRDSFDRICGPIMRRLGYDDAWNA